MKRSCPNFSATVVDSEMLDWWLRGFGKAVSKISKTKLGGIQESYDERPDRIRVLDGRI